MGGVVVPAGAALATPPDSIHAKAHGAIAVCRYRLRRMGVPAIGAATAPPQVLTTRLQHQESRVTQSQDLPFEMLNVNISRGKMKSVK